MMSIQAELTGLYVAITTPFRDGHFDDDAFCRHIAHLIENGTRGIVVCGTTGEAATLTREEKQSVIGRAVQVAGNTPVIAGVGTNNTATTLSYAADALDQGAAALLVVTPYYNRPPQDGLFEHYRIIAAQTSAPIIIYNVPSRTGVSITPETIAKLALLPEIVAVKDATADMHQAAKIQQLCGERVQLLSGDDFTALAHVAVGGAGAISVVGNVDPRRTSHMLKAAADGNVAEAQRLNLELLPLNEALFEVTNPIPVKRAVSLLGFGTADVRLPLTPLNDEHGARLAAIMRGLELIEPSP